MSPAEQRPPAAARNLATSFAMVTLALISLSLFALVAIFFPHVQGIVLVGALFALPALFHYFVWGRWMSRLREQMLREEAEREAVERRTTRGSAGRTTPTPPTAE
ncbi:MAG: hypothetical protein ACKOGA_08260 [Planctomycetaceae bacterium]